MKDINNLIDDKNSNSIYIFILIFLIIIFISAIIVNITGIDKDKTTKYTHVIIKGYEFKIPIEYKVVESNKYGVICTNNKYSFNIEVDNKNTYNDYLESIKTKFPEESDNLELDVGKSKYAGIIYSKKDEEEVVEYITKKGNITILGLIRFKNKKFDTKSLEVLDNILNTYKYKEKVNKNDKLIEYNDEDINKNYNFK